MNLRDVQEDLCIMQTNLERENEELKMENQLLVLENASLKKEKQRLIDENEILKLERSYVADLVFESQWLLVQLSQQQVNWRKNNQNHKMNGSKWCWC